MKNFTYAFLAFVIVFLVLGGSIVQAQTPVSKWGSFKTAGSNGGILNWKVAVGNPGNASISGTSKILPAANWVELCGAFDPITATQSQALTVSGTVEFVGSGFTKWSELRYGLTWLDSLGTLRYAGTDSAYWDGYDNRAYGYNFMPHSGSNDQVGYGNGNANQGVLMGGRWFSSYGGAIGLGVINQKPARAEATAGIYDFAWSVQPLATGGKELRWYLIKQGTPTPYWFGGTVLDTTANVPKFNSLCFAVNGQDTLIRALKFTNVVVKTGAPITVPEAPWQAYYVDQWGFINASATNTNRMMGWQFVPGGVIGDAGVKGPAYTSDNWVALRGAFFEPITPTTSKALIVTGKMEFIGGGFDSWSGLRYALCYSDSAGKVIKDTSAELIDSTRWSGTENYHNGYLICPHSGANDQISWLGAGKNGTHGGIIHAARTWLSTNDGNDYVLGNLNQAPARAVAGAGTYNFAFSVQPLADGTQELRFYLIKDDNKYYFAATVIDNHSPISTKKFNSICFATHYNSTTTAWNVHDVKVDIGAPITVPVAPWQAYYIDQWGFIGGLGGTSRIGGWKFIPDPDGIIGNAGIGGSGPITPASAWSAIRGGFFEPFTATNARGIKVTGTMEFVGEGFKDWSELRYGLFYHDSAGSLLKTPVDSTRWSGYESLANGYMFTPHSGANDQASWITGGIGTQGVVRNQAWISTYGNSVSLGVIDQRPIRAVATAGKYNFAISVQPQSDGSKEVRFYLIKQGTPTTYWYGGIVKDMTQIPAVFNGVCFAVNGQTTDMRALKLTDVKVDTGIIAAIPEAPWNAYYPDRWGFLGTSKIGGWKFVPGDVIGNAGISGTAPGSGWSAIGADFDALTPTTAKALIVTGKMQFVGGGFEPWSSLRFGVFYFANPGTLNKTSVDSTRWSGVEAGQSGYLFLPQSGTYGPVDWMAISQVGSVGAVVNDAWMSTFGANDYVLGTNRQSPQNAVAGAGTYDFGISIAPQANGTSELRFKLVKSDNSYIFTGKLIDSHSPLVTTKFTFVAFALNTLMGSSTKAMNLTDVKIDLGSPIAVGVEETAETVIPTVYALNQNYPNPFNPSTTIRYDIPKDAQVSLKIYDVLGRHVATLADGIHAANRYTVEWNASGLGSGVYFYKIDARNQDGSGDFSAVKRLLLVK
jgi:hypothetical protein